MTGISVLFQEVSPDSKSALQWKSALLNSDFSDHTGVWFWHDLDIL